MRLDRNARESKGPRIAELAFDRLRVVAAAGGLEKAAPGFENDRGRGEAEPRELGRNDTAFARASGVKGLHHGAEIFAQAGGLARGNAKRAPRLFEIQTQQLRRAGSSTQSADCRRGMKTVLVMARID